MLQQAVVAGERVFELMDRLAPALWQRRQAVTKRGD